MKHLILILGMLFSLSGCSGDDKKPQEQEVSIIGGTWKLIEGYGSAGGAGRWSPVEDGYTYSFMEDSTLVSNRFSCDGTYVQSSDKLTISFDCPESQLYGTYSVAFENNKLILTDSVNCDERCAKKYERVN